MDKQHQEFVEANEQKSVTELALLLSKQKALDKDWILRQVNGRQKARIKLPEYYAQHNILYPPSLSLEQCSSEATASFKAIHAFEKHEVLDLTGGFGVDSYYFSKIAEQVTYVEPNKQLFKIAMHNFKKLGAENVQGFCGTAEEFLAQNEACFDLIYIDPSRRAAGQRVFLLEDCTPDVLRLRNTMLEIAPQVLIKLAPMLDIHKTIDQLGKVSKVQVVALKNEVKELLFLLEQEPHPLRIETYDLRPAYDRIITFHLPIERLNDSVSISYSQPQQYLYEPNAAVLKAGFFNEVAEAFELKKLAPNTHLYSSKYLDTDFPGRIFEVIAVYPYQYKAFRKAGIQKANVSTRNFPAKPEQVAQKLKLKTGGDVYIFACRDRQDKPIIVVCQKTS